jgi:hypothetical protein
MATKEFDRIVRFILSRAIYTDHTYYHVDNVDIDKKITRRLDELAGQLWDLVDEQTTAREINDSYLVNKIDKIIQRDDLLRTLAIYHDVACGKKALSDE